MADKIIIEVDLEKGDVNGAVNAIEKSFDDAGKNIGKNINDKVLKSVETSFQNISKFALKSAAAFAAFGGVTLAKSIAAASDQESAINKMNTSLLLAGDYSEKASKDIQEFASKIQLTTTLGDDLALSLFSMARNFTKTTEEAKKLTLAAIDLSRATGDSLESSVEKLGKTYSGQIGLLAKLIPETKKLTEEQLKSGAAIDAVLKRFGGAEANAVNTYAGRVQQIKNNFGDAFEPLGFAITKSPLVVAGLKSINDEIITITESMVKVLGGKDFGRDFVLPYIESSKVLTELFVPALELAFNIGRFVFNGLTTAVNNWIAILVVGVERVSALFASLGIGEEFAEQMQMIRSATTETADESLAKLSNSFDKLGDFSLSEKLAQRTLELEEWVKKNNEIIKTGNEDLKNNASVTTDTVGQTQEDFYGTMISSVTDFKISFNDALVSSEESLKNFRNASASIMKQGIARSISGGIQNIIASLQKGENVFDNFGKFLLTTFGDLAIQLGSFFIAEGIAVSALQKINPPAAIIAAGAGLVALGSIIKGFAGSGGGGGKVGTGGGGSSPTEAGISTPSEQFASGSETIQAQKQTNINLTVQGNVIGDKGFGKFVADSLTEAGAKEGISILSTRVRTA